jgi:tripartite-type tricarboxylate transporter receptor subunit TctC
MSTIRSQYQQNVDAGELSILMTFGKERTKDFPNVASLFELVKPGDDRQLADLIFGADAIGRPIAAPPGMAPERVALLRKAFREVFGDPEVAAEAQRLNIDWAPLAGEEVQQRVEKIYAASPQVIARVKAALGTPK